jgi:phosphate transport system substrate-binding protein
MRLAMAGGILLLLAALVATAAATGSGKVLLYGGAGQGKVIFDGRTHASAGIACNDCHTAPALFQMQQQALITMDDHGRPKACFACHNGLQAFNDCEKCHRKF